MRNRLNERYLEGTIKKFLENKMVFVGGPRQLGKTTMCLRCFRIAPYGTSKINAVKKEKKLYLWDWSQIEDSGAKFENLVASHLLKYCHFLEDTQGDEMELRFLRDVAKREVDFVVLKNKKPIFAVECKSGEKALSDHIRYFKERTKIPSFYQVHLGTKDFSPEEGVRVLPFVKFCREVGLV